MKYVNVKNKYECVICCICRYWGNKELLQKRAYGKIISISFLSENMIQYFCQKF